MPIPANIITGFLGVGKTTSILNLLKNKPANEKWAVLVNEFGEVGIDGAMMADSGAMIKEVPGGCMCCTAGVPTSVGITTLLRQKPDRLLIEPTGLGHPHKIANVLLSEQFRDHIDLKATITLVDPRNLLNPKYTENQNFNDQLDVADIVIANKADECTEEARNAFDQWIAAQHPPKAMSLFVANGEFPAEILNTERVQGTEIPEAGHHHEHASLEPQFQLAPDQKFIRKENKGQGHFSCGWIFGSEVIFDFDKLFSFMYTMNAERIKGVINTTKGCHSFNVANGIVSAHELTLEGFETRIEIIDSQPLACDALEAALLEISDL